jgi:predicted nucleotidyltransferase
MSDPPRGIPNPILSVGTHVVLRVACKASGGDSPYPAGTVGVVVEAPLDNTHSYRVRLPDGAVVSLRRQELTIRKHVHREGLSEALSEYDLHDYVIYRCVVGSRAFGLAGDDSDTDRRGIYLPPAELHWSLYGVPEQLEDDAAQECYWELQKFLAMALKANPNVLECLYSPLVEHATPLAQELLAMRSSFLSRFIYQTYNGYVLSQFKKLESDFRSKGAPRWKHAMHLIRLLLSGITALREGVVLVRVEEHRDRLLAVRRGEMPWEEVEAWRQHLHRDFDAAFATTALPERPDFDKANAFLLKARRSMVAT